MTTSRLSKAVPEGESFRGTEIMMTWSPSHTATAALTAALLSAAPAVAQDRFNVAGGDVAVYNIAGEVRVVPSSAGEVSVELYRGGRDGAELRVEVGPVGGRQALRVIYPARRVVYGDLGRGSRTSVRVRSDGTWGGGGGLPWGGDRIDVAGSGSGLEAWADMVIAVPRGQRLDVYVAVGRITAENIDGRIRLDTHAGAVEAAGMSGSLLVDTGSGSVRVAGMQGDLEVDTGSGSVEVSDVRGSRVVLDTGSGRVRGRGIAASSLSVDTGSGGIELRDAIAPDVRLDTGSGAVDAEIAGEIDRLVVDTGSGSVTLRLSEGLSARLEIDTGSGGIDVDFPVMVTRRGRTELRGQIGDGRGRITIDTGSGGVRIRRL